MSEHRSRIKVAIYSSIGIAIVLVCTIFVCSLIVDLWMPPFLKQSDKVVKLDIMKDLVQGLPSDNYTIAHKSVQEREVKQRFHNWEIPMFADNVSTCITCHGDVPHDKDEVTRAFLNKHSVSLACETCHIQTESAAGFATMKLVWYNVSDGSVNTSFAVNSPLIASEYKIVAIPMSASSYGDKQMQKDALKLLSSATGMGVEQKKAEIEKFHKNKLEKPLMCRSCHTADKSLIPFDSLGYTAFRRDQIINTEVVGMVEKYKLFYLPTFITHGKEK